MIEQKTLGECAWVIPGVLPLEKKKLKSYAYTAVQPGQLTTNGVCGEYATIVRDTPCNEDQFLQPGDVLLKRLNPECAVVFDGEAGSVVASSNIFIIRPKNKLDSNYLAFLLEKSNLLQRISQLSGVGSTVAALTTAQIEGGVIPLPPMAKQVKLGKIWTLSKKKENILLALQAENDRLMRALCGKLYQ